VYRIDGFDLLGREAEIEEVEIFFGVLRSLGRIIARAHGKSAASIDDQEVRRPRRSCDQLANLCIGLAAPKGPNGWHKIVQHDDNYSASTPRSESVS
jgi:hypothetical protein